MQAGYHSELFLPDEDATTQFGARIAPCLIPGDCILLDGPIGSGKTHLARAIIQTRIGTSEDVPSPTYTLVQVYENDEGEIWHSDLYRLTNTFEISELGLEQAFETAITLVEWPDRLPDPPLSALRITFKQKDDGRLLQLASDSDHWSKLNV